MADIQRYLNLITSEHQGKPKFTAWLTVPLSILDGASTLLDEFNSCFDLDNAIGNQLDIIGDIVGVKRTVNFQPTPYYSTAIMGVAVLVRPSPILDDITYRIVIRARILQNMWDGTLPSLYEMWGVLFNDSYLIIKDNQDMSMDIYIIGLSSRLQRDLTTNGYLIPKPMGVRVNYSYSSVPLFAFGVEGSGIQGFGEGTWGSRS